MSNIVNENFNPYEEQIKNTLNKIEKLEETKDTLTNKEYIKQKKAIYKQDEKEVKKICKTYKEE